MTEIQIITIAVVGLSLLVSLFTFFTSSRKQRALNEQLQLQLTLIEELKTQIQQNTQQQIEIKAELSEPILENEQVTKQLSVRTKNLQTEIEQLKSSLAELASSQPEDRLYSRAKRMIELGADADELVQECSLPRAEAELLLSIHLKKEP